MNKTIFKKLIIVAASFVAFIGVILTAYWMSGLNTPDDEEGDIPINIGIGDSTGTNLKVIEKLEKENLQFVPSKREDDDIIVPNPISSYVFEVKITWEYDPTGNEKGVLIARISEFIFFDEKPYDDNNRHEIQLTVEQQETLKESFEISLVKKTGDVYVKPEGHYLIEPNSESESQTIYIELKFTEDVADKYLWDLIVNKIFELRVELEVEQTIVE